MSLKSMYGVCGLVALHACSSSSDVHPELLEASVDAVAADASKEASAADAAIPEASHDAATDALTSDASEDAAAEAQTADTGGDGATDDHATLVLCSGAQPGCFLVSAGYCRDTAGPQPVCADGGWVCPTGSVVMSQCRCGVPPRIGCDADAGDGSTDAARE